MSDPRELAERCEKATGPDRELDAMIHARDGLEGVGYWSDAPAFTASLDSALTLVPESDDTRAVFWRLGNDGEGGNPGDFKAEVLVASTYTAKTFSGLADTAPLALCAAALRAREEDRG